MSSEEFAKIFGWGNICLEGCHHPYDHSHDFTLGRHIEKKCTGCGANMQPNAQRYGTEFGANRAILNNFYQCKQCKKIDSHVLYDGPPKDYNSIRDIVLGNLNSRLS